MILNYAGVNWHAAVFIGQLQAVQTWAVPGTSVSNQSQDFDAHLTC